MAQATMTAKELAKELGITPKALRRFIRSNARTEGKVLDPCGAGNRYSIAQSDAKRLIAAFRASSRMGTNEDKMTEAPAAEETAQ